LSSLISNHDYKAKRAVNNVPVHALAQPVAWNRLLGGSLLGNHGNGINLHKKIGVCQCQDKDTGNNACSSFLL
jgi:hypothetical protein